MPLAVTTICPACAVISLPAKRKPAPSSLISTLTVPPLRLAAAPLMSTRTLLSETVALDPQAAVFGVLVSQAPVIGV